jgi:predicted dehydrogenase
VDYRRALESRDIDAAIIATPDHWHVPMTLHALQAGKDIYVEKPVTHRLNEGEALLRAAASSQQVVATGTQQRSWAHFLEAKRLVAEGALGKITFVRCHWSQNYSAFRAQLAQDIDQSQLDWEGWLGPAPPQPFDATRFCFWRFFWDFGGGSVTDLMTHWIDVIQWFMGSAQISEVRAFGTTYTNHWLEAPDTVVATMAFPEGYTAVFEGNMTFGLLGCGIEFRGDKALMILNRDGYAIYEEGAMPLEAVALPDPIFEYRRSDNSSWTERVDGTGTLDNLRDWIGCVRSRAAPNAHVQAGVESAATAHWVNRAIRGEAAIKVS